MEITNKIQKYVTPVIAVTSITTIGVIIFAFNRNGNKIVRIAKKYIGQTEIQPNKGWVDKVFEKEMKDVGWQQPLEYCVLFVKLILLKSFHNKKDIANAINVLFNASSQNTWQKLLKNEHYGFYKITKKPKVGSIAFYRHINNPAHGHAEIVLNVNKNSYTVISANGSIGVEVKERKYLYNSNKMRLLGFVNF